MQPTVNITKPTLYLRKSKNLFEYINPNQKMSQLINQIALTA